MSSWAAAGWSGFLIIATVEIVAKVGVPATQSTGASLRFMASSLETCMKIVSGYSPAAIMFTLCVYPSISRKSCWLSLLRGSTIDSHLTFELRLQIIFIIARYRRLRDHSRIKARKQKIGCNAGPITVGVPRVLEQIFVFRRSVGASYALLLTIKQWLRTIAQNVSLHSTGAKLLHDAGYLPARTEINMADIEKRILLLGGLAKKLEVAHRHRRVQNHLALFFGLVQNLRGLRENGPGPKDREHKQESKPDDHGYLLNDLNSISRLRHRVSDSTRPRKSASETVTTAYR